MMAAAASQLPPDRDFILGLSRTPIDDRLDDDYSSRPSSRKPSLLTPQVGSRRPSNSGLPGDENAAQVPATPVIVRGRPRQPTFPRHPAPSTELTAEITAKVGGLDLARGRQRQPPPVAPPAPASATVTEGHKVWLSGMAPGDLPEPSPESQSPKASPRVASPRTSPRANHQSPRLSVRDKTKKARNKMASVPERRPQVDHDSTTTPISLKSRQSSARSPWKHASHGENGETFLRTPEPFQLQCIKTTDDDKEHLEPIEVQIDLKNGVVQDADAGRKVTFDRETTGQGVADGTHIAGAAELQLTRLEEMLEQRMDAFDKKLDSVLLTVSTVAAARGRQQRLQVPDTHTAGYGRRNSGWGESTIFGPGHGSPVFDSGDPRTMGTGSGSLNGSGGEVEQGRGHSKDSVRIDTPQERIPEALSGDPSVFNNGIGSGSVTAGMGRQYSPGASSEAANKLALGGNGRSAQQGKSEPQRRERSNSRGSESTHRSAASSASRLSARGVEKRSKLAQKIWIFFEEPNSSIYAHCHHNIYMVLIFVSAILPPIETLPNPPLDEMSYYKLSAGIESIFLVELLLKWYASPNRWGFATRFYNLLDFAIVPIIALRSVEYYVFSEHGTHHDALTDLVIQKTLLVIVPVMRLIKALRGQRNFALLTHTLTNVVEPLCVPMFMLMIVCMIFSCAIYVVESRENILSVPEAMWLVILTVSTVGYGDIVPRSDLGRIFTSMLVFFGCLCMAMPIGIVGTAFTETWRNRARILAMKRIRDRLNQWGYDDDDLRVLFRTYDKNQAGVLDVLEFIGCIRSLKLGLDEGQVKSLFHVLDVNGNGSLDMEEFVHVMGLKKSAFQFGVF